MRLSLGTVTSQKHPQKHPQKLQLRVSNLQVKGWNSFLLSLDEG